MSDPESTPAWLQMDGQEAARLRDALEGSDDPLLRGLHAKLALLTSENEHDEDFRQAAFEKYAGKLQDGDLDFQSDGMVSRGDDGAYVMAFLWVDNAEAGLDLDPEDDVSP